MPALIEHLVVLMLENRSFDNLLGWLYPGREDFDGLTGREFNVWHQAGEETRIEVWNDSGMSRTTARGPDPDPGELFTDMQQQFCSSGPDIATPRHKPDMGGFVDNYMAQPRSPDGARPDPRAIMQCFSPEQVPVLSELARSFGVSDRWFASAPCQTWPNRFFTHTGTAGGWTNNEPQHWPYRMPSLFRHMSDHQRDWAVYFHDLPNAANLRDVWTKLPTAHFRLFHKEFEDDAAAGALPSYCFIEPRYFLSAVHDKVPNAQQPPTYLAHAEELVARTYNALRQGPKWEQTLFVIVYDEHGGLYDHVPPPPAVSPGGPYPDGFTFDRYGARVPAVIVSPHIPAGSVIRPPNYEHGDSPYDHCSIIKTAQELFDLGPPLTARVAAAPSLVPLLGSDGPVNSGPPRIDYVAAPAPEAEIRRLRKVNNKTGLRRSMARSTGWILGTVARLSAHFRYGTRKAFRHR
jgi:phospholipase C